MEATKSIFLKRMETEYSNDMVLPKTYKYLNNNSIRPVVPSDTAEDGIFIIGAYPTSRFTTIGTVRDVPMGDINAPFSNESYLDGERKREVKSGVELDTLFFKPLGIKREHCWITNLVKIFLFKPGHINKYRSLGYSFPEFETRSHFEEYAQDGLSWLKTELRFARPRLIISLGLEAAGFLQVVKGNERQKKLLGGTLKRIRVGSQEYPIFHFAHPGILMRPSHDKNGAEINPWPRLHRDEHIPLARQHIQSIIGFVS